jgi:hypothetical protein
MSVDQAPAAGKGFIYILSNESMPGLLKVGLTENSVRQRIRELSGSTGVPTEFKVERFFEIDARCLLQVEQTIHRDLKDSGFHHQKEFFRLSITQCTNVAEEVILRITGIRSPDLVGLAERRLKAKAAREKWEAEELARRQSLVREANLKIAEQRREWISKKKSESQDKRDDPWYSVVGNFFATLVGGALLLAVVYALGVAFLETVGFGLGLFLSTIAAYWFYQKHKAETEYQERKLNAEAERMYPFKSIDDFPARIYRDSQNIEEKKSRSEEEQRLQDRISKYREVKRKENNDSRVINREKSWRLYRKNKQLLHIPSNTYFDDGAFWRDRNSTVTGYWTNNSKYPFAWDKDIEEVP